MAPTAAIDFLVVPTPTFRILYVVVILSHERRKLLHLAVTTNPTAEWAAHQVTEAFPWDTAPKYIIRDRERPYGRQYNDRLGSMCIQDVSKASQSP